MKTWETSYRVLMLTFLFHLTHNAVQGKILQSPQNGGIQPENLLHHSSPEVNQMRINHDSISKPRKLIRKKLGQRSSLIRQLIKIERDLTRQITLHKNEKEKTRKLSNPYGEATITPLIINAPLAKPEKVKANEKIQKPVYFIPQILLPKKQKKLVFHHPASMEEYTRHMLTNSSPAYLNWMLNNQSYKNWMETNPYAKSLMEDNVMMKEVGKAIPSTSIGPF